MLKRVITGFIVLVVLLFTNPAPGASGGDRISGKSVPVRNVIVMVPDGCAQSVQTLARWIKGDRLHVDGLNTGTVTTHAADSVITDSAAAATAFATGHKTTNGFIGIGPRTDALLTGMEPTAAPYVPVASVLEGARLRGMATGLVVTSRITHATAAAFASHIDDRDNENGIMEHMVYQGLDVVFGGGARHLIPAGENHTASTGDTWPGSRTDGENLLEVLQARGYRFVDNRTGLGALTRGPVWGLFDDSHLDPDIDRDDLHPSQPSIAEMTEKAIELLSADQEGFFLMVEGSQIDWAAHAHDPAYMVTEFLAFDDAVGKALAFAEKDQRTLVLVFPDHNTGGLTIGRDQAEMSGAYDRIPVAAVIDPIKDADITLRTLLHRYAGASPGALRKAFVAHWGPYWNRMSGQQAATLLRLGTDSETAARYIGEQFTAFGWTTHGHTGDDVPLWSFGPGRPVGTFDNTALAGIVADALGFDLGRISRQLFVDVAARFPQFEVDDEDPANPVLKINGYRLPVSKDIVETGTRRERIGGIVVHAPMIDRFFIPAEAERMIR